VFGNFLAAGRVKDGKFNVRSSTEKVKFFWEVKAVRSDIEPLIVTADKEPVHEIRPPENPVTGESRPSSGLNRDAEAKA
jgi:hypothetical protein